MISVPKIMVATPLKGRDWIGLSVAEPNAGGQASAIDTPLAGEGKYVPATGRSHPAGNSDRRPRLYLGAAEASVRQHARHPAGLADRFALPGRPCADQPACDA